MDPDPLDQKKFGFLDPDPQKYADQQIRIQFQGMQNIKTKPKSELLRKSESIKNKNLNFSNKVENFKKSVNRKEMLRSRILIDFFRMDPDQHQNQMDPSNPDPDPGHFFKIYWIFFQLLVAPWIRIRGFHIFADPDPGSQNLADPTDPDPKH